MKAIVSTSLNQGAQSAMHPTTEHSSLLSREKQALGVALTMSAYFTYLLQNKNKLQISPKANIVLVLSFKKYWKTW